MLHDRDYMRESRPDGNRSLTINLIILLVVLFVVQCSLNIYGRLPIDDWFGLSIHGIKELRFWQLLTFQFLHATPWPWHLLFNCLGLYFFGRTVEETLGRREFLKIYFAAGFCGGLVQLLATWLLPGHWDAPLVGASAGIMGLLAAYAWLFPMREITILVMFFPITVRAQYLFWGLLAWSVFATVVPQNSNVADAAHLGGLLAGFAYIRWGREARDKLTRWSPFEARQRKLQLVKTASQRTDWAVTPKREPAPDLPAAEFISREVDPILDKISAHGIQSLTDRERQILEAARRKMSKR